MTASRRLAKNASSSRCSGSGSASKSGGRAAAAGLGDSSQGSSESDGSVGVAGVAGVVAGAAPANGEPVAAGGVGVGGGVDGVDGAGSAGASDGTDGDAAATPNAGGGTELAGDGALGGVGAGALAGACRRGRFGRGRRDRARRGGGHLHVVGRRARRRRDRALARQLLEIGLDRAPEADAVVLLEALHGVDVGDQRIALGPELEHLALEAATLRLRLTTRRGLGLGHHRAGLRLRVIQDLARLGLCLGDGLVGGPLREQERPVQHLLGLARLARLRVPRLGAGREVTDLGLEPLDPGGGALEQVVDVVAVVAAEPFPDVDVAEFPWRHVHDDNRSDGSSG